MDAPRASNGVGVARHAYEPVIVSHLGQAGLRDPGQEGTFRPGAAFRVALDRASTPVR